MSFKGKVKDLKLNPYQRLLSNNLFDFIIKEIGFFNIFVHKLGFRARKLIKKLGTPINPDGILALLWEVIIISLVFLDLFLLPYIFAFEEELYSAVDKFEIIDNTQFSLYCLNILINLNTSYYDQDGYLICSRKKIILSYLSGSFWIDALSSVPYKYTLYEPEPHDNKVINQSITFIKLIRFLRILRVFKVLRSNRILKWIEQHDYFNPLIMGILNLAKLSFIITCLAHWCACCWYLLGKTNTSMNWLQRANLEEDSAEERYVASLYFAITTMMTVGYGDISPLNLRERIFGIFLMIIGGGTFGYTMTSIAEIIKSLEREESRQRKRTKAIVNYMQKKGLNKNLQDRVKKYLAFVHGNEEKSSQEDRDLLSILSNNLQEEISQQINGKFADKHPVLKQILTREIANMIPLHLEESIVSPGDLIYSKNDSQYSLYLISKGKVQIRYVNFKQPLATLQNGSYFGIESFFTDKPRTIEVISVEYSHLIYMKRNKFLEILENYPIDKEKFTMIKDKAILYGNYSSLQIKCYVCNKSDHITSSCPDINVIVDKENAIRNYLKDLKTFNKNFSRRNRKPFNIRRDLIDIQNKAQKLQEVHNLIDQNSSKQVNFMKTDESEDNQQDNREEASSPLLCLEKSAKVSLDRFGKKSFPYKTEKSDGFANYDIIALGKMIELAKTRTFGGLHVEERLHEDDFEFDKVKNYEIYFAHNNLAKIIQQINEKNKNKSCFVCDTVHDGQNLIGRMKRILKAKAKSPRKSESLSIENSTTRNSKKDPGEISRKKINSSVSAERHVNLENSHN